MGFRVAELSTEGLNSIDEGEDLCVNIKINCNLCEPHVYGWVQDHLHIDMLQHMYSNVYSDLGMSSGGVSMAAGRTEKLGARRLSSATPLGLPGGPLHKRFDDLVERRVDHCHTLDDQGRNRLVASGNGANKGGMIWVFPNVALLEDEPGLAQLAVERSAKTTPWAPIHDDVGRRSFGFAHIDMLPTSAQ